MSEPDVYDMSVYSDLVLDPEEDNLLDKLGVMGNKRYPDGTKHCDNCGSKKLAKLVLLGAYDGPLFWLCRKCSHLHLRFTRRFTMKCVVKAEPLYSDPEMWCMPERKEYA